MLGCIADDFTGATDLANTLVRGGMRVVQTIGLPEGDITGVDAIVVALKSRTIAASDAVRQSLQALRWLRAAGCGQFYFKVCSTFDSTPAGNIGPVAEAMLAELEADFCCVTPAFPDNARTVFKGHLFVGDVLLGESAMREHPLTPMTDSNLVRVLQAQARGGVGRVDLATVRCGADAIRARVQALRDEGLRLAIVDAIENEDLRCLGRALADAPLIVAGSGLAIGLPQNRGLRPTTAAARLPRATGAKAVVSGSCSVATNRQVQAFLEAGLPAFAVDPLALAAGEDVVGRALAWAQPRLGNMPLLVYSSAMPGVVQQVQGRLGVAEAGVLVETALAAITAGLVQAGARQLVVAGGETSGACVQALGVRQMRIGPQIDPGVPWCHGHAGACRADLHLALKSGNFGAPDFFVRAFECIA